jgi:MFS family permease
MTVWRQAKGHRDAVLFLLYSAIFHIGFMGVVDVVLNFYFVSLGHDNQIIGLLQSLPRLAGLLTSVPLSIVANRIGARRVIIFSTVGMAASLALLVVLPTLPLLSVNRFLQGLFYGAQQIAVAPLMVTLVGAAGRTRFFAYHNLMSMASAALGTYLGGFLPAILALLALHAVPTAHISSQSTAAYGLALLVAAALTLMSILPIKPLRPQGDMPVAAPALFSGASHVSWRYLGFLSLPMLIFGFTGGLTFPFYNLFFRTEYHLPDDTVGLVLSVGWFGMALIPLLNSFWENRFGRAASLMMTMTIAACGFFGLSLSPSLLIGVLAFVVGVSFRNAMQPLYQPLVLDSLPAAWHNNASGMSMVMWNVGWFAATAISGFWQTAYGYPFIMRIVSIGVFITGIAIILIFRRPRPCASSAVPT